MTEERGSPYTDLRPGDWVNVAIRDSNGYFKRNRKGRVVRVNPATWRVSVKFASDDRPKSYKYGSTHVERI